MKKILLGSVVLLVAWLDVRAEEFYIRDVPGVPEEHKERLKSRDTGLGLRYELILDGKSFAFYQYEEMSGDPRIRWLTKDKFAFYGCSSLDRCDYYWRIGQISTKTHSEITLPGYTKIFNPEFLPPYMAFSGRLPNGNYACAVYDWSTEKILTRWDTGSTSIRGMDIRFGQDRRSVTCTIITGWKPNLDRQGDSPPELPIHGKSNTIRF